MNILEYIGLPGADHMSPLLMLGIILVAGVCGGWVARRLHIPAITGNIVAGAILGSSVLDFFHGIDIARSLQPLSTFAMGLIALAIGGHLAYRRIHNALRRILLSAILEVTVAVALTVTILRLLGAEWPIALLLGTVAAATAPATTVALVRENLAKGSYVKTLLSVVAIDNILCIVLFAVTRNLVADYYVSGQAGFRFGLALFHACWQLFGSLGIGLAIGFATERLVRHPRTHHFSMIIVAVLLSTGLATYCRLSPLLATLFMGVFLANKSKEGERQLLAFAPIELLLYTSFFTLAGVSLHLETLSQVGVLCAAYLVARAVGKGIGAALGGILARSSRRIWSNVAMGLIPQAGVAIGLVVLLEGDDRIPNELSHLVATLVLAAVTVNEIIGPFFTRASLRRAKEAGLDRPRLIEFLQEEYILTNLTATDKWDALAKLTDFYVRTHHVPVAQREHLYETIRQREESMSTAIGLGAAIPHGRVDSGDIINGVLGICREGVDFDAPDGRPVRILMLIVTPKEDEQRHLEVMASLASMISDDLIRTRLVAAIDANDAWEVIEDEEARNYNYFLESDEEAEPAH